MAERLWEIAGAEATGLAVFLGLLALVGVVGAGFNALANFGAARGWNL